MQALFHKISASAGDRRVQAGLVAIALFFVTARVLVEFLTTGLYATSFVFGVKDISVLPQWLLWYGSVFLMVLACFRHLARVRMPQALLLLPGAAILLIPVGIALALHAETKFSYLYYTDPGVWRAIATLMYTSPANHFMFYELLVLVVSAPIIAYGFSRSVVRAALTPIVIYAALIFAHAFMYACPASDMCLLPFRSYILPPLYGAFYFALMAAAWLCALLWPELREYARRRDAVFTRRNLAYASAGYIPFFGASVWAAPAPLDVFLVSFAYFALFYALRFLSAHRGEGKLLAFSVFLCAYAIVLGGSLAIFFYWPVSPLHGAGAPRSAPKPMAYLQALLVSNNV
jgi:hypothetical protein